MQTKRLFSFRTIVAAAALFGSAAVAQSTIDLSLSDARALATRAAAAGDFALALELADKLLEVNPDDRTALVVRAVAAPQTGDPEAG